MIVQACAREGVERREGFVEQQHLRPRRERPRDRNPLRLSAGKLARPAMRILRQPHALQHFADEPIAFRTRPVGEAEADILLDREPRQQPRLLKHEPHERIGLGDDFAVEPDAPARRLVEPCRKPQERALAAARTADNGDDLAFLDFEIQSGERARAVGIGFVRRLYIQHGALNASPRRRPAR
jgi:hypothetical protein